MLAAACGGLALLVLAAILLPLLRRTAGPADAGQFDRAVYRDQLSELEQDVARGLIPPDAAAPARLQIERRLLATVPGAQQAPPAARRSPVLAVVAAVALIAAPALIYLRLGAPQLPGQPFASRPAASATATANAAPNGHTSLAKSAAELAARLEKDPNNAEGWLLYARTTAALGQWHKSMEAYGRVLTLTKGEPIIWAGFGEMQTMAADGVVTPGARDAFNKAIALEPKNDVGRFYLALADAQAGNLLPAIDAWQKLAADLPDGNDMREEIGRRVAEAARLAGIATPALPPGPPAPPAAAPQAAPQTAAGSAAGGPDAATMAAAAAIPVAEREAMVRDMVAKLAGKLEKSPNDTDGWLRLGRAYLVLNEPAKAADAYRRAQQLSPADAGIKLQEATAEIDTLAEDAPVPEHVVQLLREVEAADPSKPEAYWYLGIAAARNSDKGEAARQWQHLLAMLPADGEDHKNVQSALDSLR